MGKQQSTAARGAAWYDAYSSRIGQTYAGAGVALRGELTRHSQQPRSPAVLRLSSRLTVVAGPTGMRSTSEAVNQVIQSHRASNVVLMCPPDSTLAMRAVSDGTAADFESWLVDGHLGTPQWRAHTSSAEISTIGDISLNYDARSAILDGPLAQESWACRRSDARVLAWDYSSGLASEAMTAVSTLHSSSPNGAVVLADIPVWMQLLHVASTHSFAQMARLVHALATGGVGGQPRDGTSDSQAPGVAAVAALLSPALRMPPLMLAPEIEALSAVLPLLAAARHRAVATALRHAELQGQGHTVGVVPPAHLHGVRFAYSQLADAQQAALGADDALGGAGGVPRLHDAALEKLHALPTAQLEEGLGEYSLSAPTALPAAPLAVQGPSDRHGAPVLAVPGDTVPSTPPTPAPVLGGGITSWMRGAAQQHPAVLRSASGSAPVRPPRGVEGGVLQVLPDPLAESALLALPVPAVFSSMLPGDLGELASTPPDTPWMGRLLEQLTGAGGAICTPQSASDTLHKLAWLNTVMHKPAPWGGLVHGHALDAMAWGVGRQQGAVAVADQAAGRAAQAVGSDLLAANKAYTAAHGEMAQWLAQAPPLDLSRPDRGGVALPEATAAVVERGGFMPLRHALLALLQAQEADKFAGVHAGERGVYFNGQ